MIKLFKRKIWYELNYDTFDITPVYETVIPYRVKKYSNVAIHNDFERYLDTCTVTHNGMYWEFNGKPYFTVLDIDLPIIKSYTDNYKVLRSNDDVFLWIDGYAYCIGLGHNGADFYGGCYTINFPVVLNGVTSIPMIKIYNDIIIFVKGVDRQNNIADIQLHRDEKFRMDLNKFRRNVLFLRQRVLSW